MDEAHELGHGVAVVERWAEGIFGDEPSGWENDEVGDGGPGALRGGGEDGEDAWIRMVVGDGANGTEASEVILIGVVGAVPSDDIKGCVGLGGGEETTCEL